MPLDLEQDWGQFGSAAPVLSADTSWNTPRSPLTVTGDAISSQQPVDFNPNNGWGGFFSGLLRTGVSYGIAKDLAQSNAGATLAQQQAAQRQQLLAAQVAAQPAPLNPTLLLVVAAVVVVVLMRKG